MTVQENLEMGAYSNKEKESTESQMRYVFQLFPVLQEKRKQRAGELSGGQQQMLAIGRALMSKPSLLMFDEPSQGLAPILIEQIADALSEIKRTGIMILLVEQNVSLGLKLADRVYVLENGRIALEGKTEDVKKDDHIKKAYIGG
jgi:branched-chain amino acid transport system ATP-binding protein